MNSEYRTDPREGMGLAALCVVLVLALGLAGAARLRGAEPAVAVAGSAPVWRDARVEMPAHGAVVLAVVEDGADEPGCAEIEIVRVLDWRGIVVFVPRRATTPEIVYSVRWWLELPALPER